MLTLGSEQTTRSGGCPQEERLGARQQLLPEAGCPAWAGARGWRFLLSRVLPPGIPSVWKFSTAGTYLSIPAVPSARGQTRPHLARTPPA